MTALGGQAAAIAALRSTNSIAPTKNDLDLIDIVLAAAGKSKDAAHVVADLAVRWQDPGLWLRAVNACRAGSDISRFGPARLLNAYDKFAFPSVEVVYV